MFQSPIHRGLGCRYAHKIAGLFGPESFSPLFIGAWVVGRGPSARVYTAVGFQSPIHRGLGCRTAGGNSMFGKRLGFSPLFIGA